MVYVDRSNSLGLLVHHDPEWTFSDFLITRTSRADYSFSPLADLSLHERTVLTTRGPLSAAREPSLFARTTPSRTRTIFIIEDPGGYFRVTFASRVTLLSTGGPFFVPYLFQHIYHGMRKPD